MRDDEGREIVGGPFLHGTDGRRWCPSEQRQERAAHASDARGEGARDLVGAHEAVPLTDDLLAQHVAPPQLLHQIPQLLCVIRGCHSAQCIGIDGRVLQVIGHGVGQRRQPCERARKRLLCQRAARQLVGGQSLDPLEERVDRRAA